MKVTLQKQEKNKVYLEVELDAQRVTDTYERKFKETSKNVTVPGFRKGKAPRKMVEKFIYQDMLKRDVLEELVSASYPEALSQLETAIEPIAEPKVEINKFELNESFIYNATVEVRPEIKLGAYKDLTIELEPLAEVNDADLEDALLSLRKDHSKLVVVDRPVQENDVTLVDIYGEVEGEPIPDGATDNLQMEIKPGTFVEGFTEQLVGANLNEEKVVEVVFPEDYPVTDLRQKQGKFRVLVKEIKEVQLPELNDEFAKHAAEHMTNAVINTVEELKAKIKEDVVRSRKNEQLVKKQEALLNAIVDASEVEIPESMERREMYGLWESREGSLLASREVSQEVLEASWENWLSREDMLKEAGKRIKNTLVLSEIARKENLTLTREEIDGHLSIYARIYQKPLEEIKLMLDERGKLLPIIDDLLSSKIIRWLEENSKVTVKGEVVEAPQVEASAEVTEPVAEVVQEG